MSSTSTKTVLVTGATSGIGRFTALHLAKRGYHVIGSGRREAELAKLEDEAQQQGHRLDVVAMDVTSEASIENAKAAIDRLTGGRGVDVLVNNAGFGLIGPLTEISDAELRRQYDTNVFGLMAVTRAFVPAMQARRAGRVINVSSVGGRMTFPFMGAYNSTKYAVESLSDALRWELKPFNIDVALIEPGVIRTEFADVAMSGTDKFAGSVYSPAISKADKLRAHGGDRVGPAHRREGDRARDQGVPPGAALHRAARDVARAPVQVDHAGLGVGLDDAQVRVPRPRREGARVGRHRPALRARRRG